MGRVVAVLRKIDTWKANRERKRKKLSGEERGNSCYLLSLSSNITTLPRQATDTNF